MKRQNQLKCIGNYIRSFGNKVQYCVLEFEIKMDEKDSKTGIKCHQEGCEGML